MGNECIEQYLVPSHIVDSDTPIKEANIWYLNNIIQNVNAKLLAANAQVAKYKNDLQIAHNKLFKTLNEKF